jgi:hypothetical protein
MVVEVDEDCHDDEDNEDNYVDIPWSRQPVVGDSSDFSLLKREEAEPTAHEIRFEALQQQRY